jgi:hypothetical protein
MIGIGIATAAAGIIVVPSLLAPVVVSLGQQNGLIVPLIAVHLFVFYFGIMADVTPPVGLASFAAAAVSRGDPIRTGFVAFFYSLRSALLPFLFIFNTDQLLMNVSFSGDVFVFIIATIAMLLFTTGTQGFFLDRSIVWESAALLLVAFTLFQSGLWMDMLSPSYDEQAPAALVVSLGAAEPGSKMRLIVEGLDDVGDTVTFTAVLPVGAQTTGEERLEAFGLELLVDGEDTLIDNAIFDSATQQAGLDFDQKKLTVLTPIEQPSKYFMFVLAIALLGFMVFVQRRRTGTGAVIPG